MNFFGLPGGPQGMDMMAMMMATVPEDREIEMDFKNGKWPFGGKGKPDAIPSPSGAKCVQISKILARTDGHAGEYSFGGEAETLPATPGLYVDEVGPVPVPLTSELAEKLIARAEKSPFDHNFDTKLDESVRKSWQLEPDKVELKNPLWQHGIDRMMRDVSERLGYKKIALKCVLYKLLVYGEGGHFLKHQDTEKEKGMIATLVIQPSSLHEGGDLVIYRGGKVRYRLDFGKAAGTAAYLSHYAVHYADAEHALGKVTSGYRLALVYSICLPPEESHREREINNPLSDELAEAIVTMGPEDKSFALLLEHEYTEKSLFDLGARSLKGVDRVRVGALEEANGVVPDDKKLNLYIVKLEHKVTYGKSFRRTGWQECRRQQGASWLLTSGEGIGKVSKTTAAFNFLNPAKKTLSQMWMPHGVKKDKGYTGNEGPSTSTKYSRFAVVAWPVARHLENALPHLPMDAVIGDLASHKPSDAAALQDLVNQVKARLESERRYDSDVPFWLYSLEFYQLFFELLAGAGDAAVVSVFLADLCPALGGIRENDTPVPLLVALVRAYDWSEIGSGVMKALTTRQPWNCDKRCYSTLELSLRIVDELDDGAARQALLQMSLEKAAELDDANFCSDKISEQLWKWTKQCGDKGHCEAMAAKLKEVKPELLGPPLEALAQQRGASDELDKVAQEVVSKRVEWLQNEAQLLDRPFTWEMPRAEFRDSERVQEFLRGPEESMSTAGELDFDGIEEAEQYVNDLGNAARDDASFKMEAAGSEKEAFVKLTKTREWFDKHQEMLAKYKAELEHLAEKFDVEGSGGAKKRARHE
jgi:hypothetical protein